MTNPYLPTAIRSIFTFSTRQCINQKFGDQKNARFCNRGRPSWGYFTSRSSSN